MRIPKLKKDRQHNDQRKKDKQRSLKLSTIRKLKIELQEFQSKSVVNSVAPEEKSVLATHLVPVVLLFLLN
jgi:hypothetical protein